MTSNHSTPDTYVSWREFFSSGQTSFLILVCLALLLHAADSLIVVTMLPSIVADIGGAFSNVGGGDYHVKFCRVVQTVCKILQDEIVVACNENSFEHDLVQQIAAADDGAHCDAVHHDQGELRNEP